MATRETVRHLTSGQMKELTAALIEAVPSDLLFEAAQRWIGDKRRLGKSLRALLMAGDVAETTYRVTVDYTQSLDAMLAAGRFDWEVEAFDPKSFPVTGDGQADVEILLYHPNRDAYYQDVLAELEYLGLRPATLAELLALAATFPDLQREYTIVALGSVGPNELDHPSRPCIRTHGNDRVLQLGHVGSTCSDNRYAAVRR